MSWWDTILDFGGDILGFFEDNPNLTESVLDIVQRLAFDHPELDYDKLMEMAIQEAIINSPDIRTPQGSVTWDVDPVTGKRTATQQYSPQVQALFESLVGQAAAPINNDTYYRNPSQMGENMLGKLLGDPNFQRQNFSRAGVEIPPFVNPPPVNTTPAGGGGTGVGGGGSDTPPGGRIPGDPTLDETDSNTADRDTGIGNTQDSWWNSEEAFDYFHDVTEEEQALHRQAVEEGRVWDPFTAIQNYINSPSTSPGLKQWLIDHADEAAQIIATLMIPIPGVGALANKFVDWVVDKYGWGEEPQSNQQVDNPGEFYSDEWWNTQEATRDPGDDLWGGVTGMGWGSYDKWVNSPVGGGGVWTGGAGEWPPPYRTRPYP